MHLIKTMSSPLTSGPTNTVGFETSVPIQRPTLSLLREDIRSIPSNEPVMGDFGSVKTGFKNFAQEVGVPIYEYVAPKAKAGKEYLSQNYKNFTTRQLKVSQIYPVFFALFLFFTIMSVGIWFDWFGLSTNGNESDASLLLGLLFSVLSVIFGIALIVYR